MDTHAVGTSSRPRLIFMLPPPAMFGLAFALGALMQHLLPLAAWSLHGPAKVFGYAVLAFGICLGASLALTFLFRKTTLNPFAHPSKLVAQGLYSLTRNPMYVSLVIAYLGGALVFGSPWTLLSLLIPVAILDRVVIPYEEAQMAAAFGRDYEAYRAKVRRWL